MSHSFTYRSLFALFSLLPLLSAQALVDYTETERSGAPAQNTQSAAPNPTNQIKRVAPKNSSGTSHTAHLNFGVGHESLDVTTGDEPAKLTLNHFYTHFQTN